MRRNLETNQSKFGSHKISSVVRSNHYPFDMSESFFHLGVLACCSCGITGCTVTALNLVGAEHRSTCLASDQDRILSYRSVNTVLVELCTFVVGTGS